MVLTLDHASRIHPGRDMAKADVAWYGAEQWDAFANEYGQTTDDQAMDESGAQKFLDGDPAIHIEMAGA